MTSYFYFEKNGVLTYAEGEITRWSSFPKHVEETFVGAFSFFPNDKGNFFFFPEVLEKRNVEPHEKKRFPPLLARDDLPTFFQWEKKIDTFAKEKKLGKVVLARKTSLTFSHALSPVAIFDALPSEGVTKFLLMHDGEAFLGATPENLYIREGREIFVDIVAGTRKRGTHHEEDFFLAEELFNSEKDQREFGFVKKAVRKQLELICDQVSVHTPLCIKKAPSVQHLFMQWKGTLKEGVEDWQIIQALHPTPAMGGFPTQEALDFIRKWEPFSRKHYAAPLGIFSKNRAEVCVGIRSAELKENTLSLYAGAGIVKGSTPKKEWNELESKITPFLQVLK